jgi:Arc/MetJ-type ribon-helix-helix transcriptional regulator
MEMNIPLKKHQADWIAEQVRIGRYASEIEAIEDALAAKIADEEDVRLLREKLRRSEEDIAAGRVVSSGEVFDRLRKRIDVIAAKSGK